MLKLLVAQRAIGERLSASMLAWRHSGFSVHNGVRVRASDVEGRKKLAQYMLRAPPGDGKGIDGSKPLVRELTYHPVPDIA